MNNKKLNRHVAVIGAGISGLSCATRLTTLGYEVDLFEKSRGPSGRMSTRQGDGWRADHGAQYFTARDPLFVNELDSWIKHDVATLWEPDLKVFEDHQWRLTRTKENRYVGHPNMNSLGKYLAQNLSVQLNQTINAINRINDQWTIHSKESGLVNKQFDWLVLAMPAPQTSALLNSFDSGIAELTSQAHMKPCITLLATFDTPQDINFDAAFVNSEIISWIAKNNSKPNRSGLETWTIHTKPEWSEQFIDADNNVVTKLIIKAARALGLDCEKAQLMIHRWRYANGHIPTVPQFHLDSDAQLGLCGDWLHGGRVEGAWLSGYKLANAIAIPSP